MSEHGILQPNPALYDLEHQRPRHVLGHEVGAGAACLQCQDQCPGFQLHFWRKICVNCLCGKADHDIREEEDHGRHFVGKIFDRPLRSRAEEMKFTFGEMNDNNTPGYPTEEIVLDWVPPGITHSLANKYLQSLPQGFISIQGSEGATRRRKQLEKQFPLHDVDHTHCHQLNAEEVKMMDVYVRNVRKNIVGQGRVQELGHHSDDGHILAYKKQDEEVYQNIPPPLPYLPTSPISNTSYGSPPSPPLPPPPHEDHFYPSTERLSRDGSSSYTDDEVFSDISASSRTPKTATLGHNEVYGGTRCPQYVGQSKHFQPEQEGNLHWFCTGCNHEMPPGSVAIFAERSSHGDCWHTTCFSCTKCGEILEDLLYFYSNGQLYCGRDFAELMNIPRCSSCDELIFAEEYTKAEGRFWHMSHFCCWICDTALAGKKYFPGTVGQPHCQDCWNKRFGKMCVACGEHIRLGEQRVSLGEDSWHARQECYKCDVCQTGLSGRKVSRAQSALVCSSSCGRKLSTGRYSNTYPSTSDVSRSSTPSYAHATPSHLRPWKPLRRIQEEEKSERKVKFSNSTKKTL